MFSQCGHIVRKKKPVLFSPEKKHTRATHWSTHHAPGQASSDTATDDIKLTDAQNRYNEAEPALKACFDASKRRFNEVYQRLPIDLLPQNYQQWQEMCWIKKDDLGQLERFRPVAQDDLVVAAQLNQMF
ncbi:hypothetical protein TrRE_jg2495 [Triparma retinervis]|uniref:Uncharacterized protein n=1 Tax=Triparma retinervis TaxID=2557542 RepID=A0A9W7DNP5_9STRA|nr:hypothetical protein TrRE_jg2495 [Triparma retinervis]